MYINLLDEDSLDKAHIFILKSFDSHLIPPNPLQLDRKLVTASVMTDYVKHNSYELFPEFNRENAKRIFAPRIMNHGWVIIDQESVDYENNLKEIYYLANQFKGRVQFIHLPSHNEAYLKQFDVDMNALPALFLMDVQTMTQYAYKGIFEWGPLSEYTSKMLNGTATRYRKSEAVTPEDTSGSVTVLRASSFDELVQNQDKDVLVFFHASWCGYCQKFSPIYDELGEKFHSSENIVIAKIDAIENDIDDIMEGVVVESFPTLYYVSGPKNEKTAVLYEGSRDLKDLIEYVNFQSGSSVSVDVDHSEL